MRSAYFHQSTVATDDSPDQKSLHGRSGCREENSLAKLVRQQCNVVVEMADGKKAPSSIDRIFQKEACRMRAKGLVD